MSYLRKVLFRNEEVIARARLHWVIYLMGFEAIAAALLLLLYFGLYPPVPLWAWALAALLVLFGLLRLMLMAIASWTTEIAITNYRLIAKRGLIRREVIEIDLGKIESVDIEQSVMGRLLGYGNVIFRGTGIGANPMEVIDDPVGFAQQARQALYTPI